MDWSIFTVSVCVCLVGTCNSCTKKRTVESTRFRTHHVVRYTIAMSTLAKRVASLEGVQRLFPGATDRSVTGYSLRSEWGFMRLPVSTLWSHWVDEWRDDRDDEFQCLVEMREALGFRVNCIEWTDWRTSTTVVLSLDCRLYYTHRRANRYNGERGLIVSRTCLLRPLRRAQNRLAIRKIMAILFAKLPFDLVTEIAGFAYPHKVRPLNPLPSVN